MAGFTEYVEIYFVFETQKVLGKRVIPDYLWVFCSNRLTNDYAALSSESQGQRLLILLCGVEGSGLETLIKLWNDQHYG